MPVSFWEAWILLGVWAGSWGNRGVGNTRLPGLLRRGGAVIESGVLCPCGEGAPLRLQKLLGCLKGPPCPPSPPPAPTSPGLRRGAAERARPLARDPHLPPGGPGPTPQGLL